MAVRVSGLRKSYAGVPVLGGVDLAVADGEIHALLGANGAGKSTLIKCIAGVVSPDAGQIEVDGAVAPLGSPLQARRAGVAVVYQDLSLAASLNVYENVFLGAELRRGPFLRSRAEAREARRWFSDLKIQIDATAPLSSLTNAELQVVEIVKALRSEPRLLILDEPTAALTEPEQRELMAHLKRLKTRDIPILYVTHRISEVAELADRVTVLRDGAVVLARDVAETSGVDLVRAIAGREVTRAPVHGSDNRSSHPLLRVRNALADRIGPIDLDLYPGEILGVFGLVGSGRTELLEGLFGASPFAAGTMELAGSPANVRSPAEGLARGVALVPSDRRRKALLSSLSARENVVLPTIAGLSSHGIRRRARERKVFEDAAAQLNLTPRNGRLEARRFSGGNQQKLVLARWLNDVRSCRLLLLDEPTQGVDIAARDDLYQALERFADRGRGVIVTSSEPSEIVAAATRVLVLSHGRIAANIPVGDVTEDRLLALAHLGEAA